MLFTQQSHWAFFAQGFFYLILWYLESRSSRISQPDKVHDIWVFLILYDLCLNWDQLSSNLRPSLSRIITCWEQKVKTQNILAFKLFLTTLPRAGILDPGIRNLDGVLSQVLCKQTLKWGFMCKWFIKKVLLGETKKGMWKAGQEREDIQARMNLRPALIERSFSLWFARESRM